MLAVLANPATATARRIAQRSVTFEVINSNTSGVPCDGDDATYPVRGHLIGPRRALRAKKAPPVTFYLHGLNSGEWNWRFPVRRYDFGVKLARKGHTSLTIDRLGYGTSGHPPGQMLCLGSGADTVHQLITALRAGDYGIGRGRPRAFDQVVLAGHDLGGIVAEIESYSYQDIDALMVMNIGDDPRGYPADPTVTAFGDSASRCAGGGEEAEPGGPGGYVRFFQTEAEVREYGFANSEPRVVDRVWALENKNPCGEFSSANTAFSVDRERLSEVRVPVMLLFTELDFNFAEKDAADAQRSYYSGSDDVTVEMMAGTGHFPMLDRNAPRFRSLVAHWLDSRGFGPARNR